MPLNKQVNYCKAVVIAHGKTELLLANYIKSNLHLPIEVFARDNGRTSIQINSLMSVLTTGYFKTKRSLMSQYAIETEKNEIQHFHIFPIMDLDDCNEEKKMSYVTGSMFNAHWLSTHIIPIWNQNNIDEVLFELGLIPELPNHKEKGKVYSKIFPIHRGQPDIEQIKELKEKCEISSKTNLNVFLEDCLSHVTYINNLHT